MQICLLWTQAAVAVDVELVEPLDDDVKCHSVDPGLDDRRVKGLKSSRTRYTLFWEILL